MDLLACPKCGSELFVSTRQGERIVFHMNAERNPVIAQPERIAADAAPINPDRLYCGACAWQGPAQDLVESRM